MVYYSMAAPQMNEILYDSFETTAGGTSTPVIRTTFPESWIFDTEFDNG